MLSVLNLAAADQIVTLAAITVFTVSIWHSSCKMSSASIAAISFIILQCAGHVSKNVVGLLDFLPNVLIGGFWYIGLSLSNLLAIFIVGRLHSKTGTLFTKTTNYIIWIFASLAVLQVARFFDRYYGFDVLGSTYKFLIPVLNLVIIGLLLVATINNFRSNPKI